MRWGHTVILSIGAVYCDYPYYFVSTIDANISLGCSYKAMRKADGGALRIQHWWRVTRPFFDRNRVNKATIPIPRTLLTILSTFIPITRTGYEGQRPFFDHARINTANRHARVVAR